MADWLDATLVWIPSWIDHQVRSHHQPGRAPAIVADGEVVPEHATGKANLETGRKLTPRHMQRIASHSRAYIAAAVMKLREKGRLKLDTPVGTYVDGLHREVARLTLSPPNS